MNGDAAKSDVLNRSEPRDPGDKALPRNVLVIGVAKTGTTVICKSVQRSLAQAWGQPCSLAFEPKEIQYFDEAHGKRQGPLVVKILHDHWAKRPHLFSAILAGELELRFDRMVFITRDPRDELISRLMYLLHVVISEDGFDERKFAAWRSVIAKKEENPQGMGLFDLATVFNEVFDTRRLPARSASAMANRIRRYWDQCAQYNDGKIAISVRYEDFVVGRLDELSRFLGVRLVVQREMGGLDRVRRSEASGNWATFMTPYDISILKPHFAELMARHNYRDWELTPVERLPSGPHTEYLDKVIELFLAPADNSS